MTTTVVLQPNLRSTVEAQQAALVSHGLASSIAARVATVWGPEATGEASQRLGWTGDPRAMIPLIETLDDLRKTLSARGISRYVLCGMGGSSLAPEVICRRDGVDLTILDSTHPDQVRAAFRGDVTTTVAVIASKSGTTIETATTRSYFEGLCRDAGVNPADHIVVVTDPGSPLDVETRSLGYTVFNADPEVGGRFSALTAFGLVPSTLAGANTRALIDEAAQVWGSLALDSVDNPAVSLASALAAPGRRHAVLSPADNLPGLGDWIEQLVAESTGKEGVGVLPVVVDSVNAPEITQRASDSVIIDLGVSAPSWDARVTTTLGAHFLLWEWATAMVGYLLGINPFDQPDVESAKAAARGLLDQRPEGVEPDLSLGDMELQAHHLDLTGIDSLQDLWDVVDGLVGTEGYLALHLYVDRSHIEGADILRNGLARKLARPVTVGFGPRFLHSTGQFHKGGTSNGVFVQVSLAPHEDLEIPGYPFSFGQLIDAQQAGDRAVLASRGYPVVSIRLQSDQQWKDILASVKAAAG